MAEIDNVNAPTDDERNSAFDRDLASRMKAAYDQVTLPDAAKESMLASLLQAAVESDAGIPPQTASSAEVAFHAADAFQAAAASPQPAKRRPHVLRFVLPAAACLAVAAVAGVVAFNAPTADRATVEYAMEAISEDAAEYDVYDDSNVAEEYGEYEFEEGDDESAYDVVASGAEPLGAATEDAAPAVGDAQAEATGKLAPADKPLFVMLQSGQQLRLTADAAGNLVPVAADRVSQRVEDAVATAEDGSGGSPCTVYLCADGSYAVSFKNDDAFYAAQAMAPAS